MRKIRESRLPMYASLVTIIETHKKLLFDMGYQIALEFLEYIYGGSYNFLVIIEDDELEAKRIIKKFSDQNFTFADAINFSLMRRSGILKAFTFDKHYSIFGFEKIPPLY